MANEHIWDWHKTQEIASYKQPMNTGSAKSEQLLRNTVARNRLLQAGMSIAGIEQLLSGQPLTNTNDRMLVARIVVAHTEGGKYMLTHISHFARE